MAIAVTSPSQSLTFFPFSPFPSPPLTEVQTSGGRMPNIGIIAALVAIFLALFVALNASSKANARKSKK